MRSIRTGFTIFFVLAGFLAVFTVSLKAFSWIYDVPFIQAMIPESPFWHGHEMLSGYSQVLLAGYLLTRAKNRDITLFVTFWCIARTAIFLSEHIGIYLAAISNVAVTGLLFHHAGLAFFRAAKRFKSAIPGIVILLLFIAEAAYQSGEILDHWTLRESALRGIIWLLIMLLFLMGGRITAAATSGSLQKRNLYRHGMAQRRLESFGLAVLGAAALCDVTGMPAELTAILVAAIALIIFLRLLDWHVWQAWDWFDVTSLHIGYAMLGIGLLFYAVQNLFSLDRNLAGFHGAMIGGFGILSLTVMSRTILQRLRFPVILPITIRFCILSLLAASLMRMAAFYVFPSSFLIASAVLWVLAFIGFTAANSLIVWQFHKQK